MSEGRPSWKQKQYTLSLCSFLLPTSIYIFSLKYHITIADYLFLDTGIQKMKHCHGKNISKNNTAGETVTPKELMWSCVTQQHFMTSACFTLWSSTRGSYTKSWIKILDSPALLKLHPVHHSYHVPQEIPWSTANFNSFAKPQILKTSQPGKIGTVS